jgi:Fe-S-cluster containining protein
MKRHRPHAFIRSIHAAVEAQAATIRRRAAVEGQPVVCRAGCAWCCAEPVYAVKAEAALAADRVRAMPAEAHNRVVAALHDGVARLAASPVFRMQEPHVVAYRKLRVVCPLLGPDNRCTIYDDRPMGCRMHMARKSADPFCADDEKRREQQFVWTGHLVAPSMAQLVATGAAEYDHFVVLLANELFGAAWESGAHTRVEMAPGPGHRGGIRY